MTSQDDIRDRVWDVIESVGVCMLTTRFGEGLRARPLEARPDRRGGTIRFVTDVRGAKDDEVAAASEVCLTFVDKGRNAYLSVTGDARTVHDPRQAAEIWKRTDDVWWPGGPDDPNARVLIVEPRLAELWDGPASKAVAAYEFARARVTGEKPNLGENRKVSVDMS
jgi:general stress protein 26